LLSPTFLIREGQYGFTEAGFLTCLATYSCGTVLDSHQLPPLHPDIRASGYLNIELCHYPITQKIQSQGLESPLGGFAPVVGRDLCPGDIDKGHRCAFVNPTESDLFSWLNAFWMSD